MPFAFCQPELPSLVGSLKPHICYCPSGCLRGPYYLGSVRSVILIVPDPRFFSQNSLKARLSPTFHFCSLTRPIRLRLSIPGTGTGDLRQFPTYRLRCALSATISPTAPDSLLFRLFVFFILFSFRLLDVLSAAAFWTSRGHSAVPSPLRYVPSFRSCRWVSLPAARRLASVYITTQNSFLAVVIADQQQPHHDSSNT